MLVPSLIPTQTDWSRQAICPEMRFAPTCGYHQSLESLVASPSTSGIENPVSGGVLRTDRGNHDWRAGSLFEDS